MTETKTMNKFTSPEYGNRLKDMFDDMVVYKDLQENSFISAFKLPSFMRDWVTKRFQDDTGAVDAATAADYIKKYIPKAEDWKAIKNRVINEGERVNFLAKVSVDIDIKTQQLSFALPDFNLSHKDTIITEDVWEKCSEALLKAEENWGVVELGYQPPMAKKPGKLRLMNFKDFRPYRVDLDEFRAAAREFTQEEWLDIVLGAVDYNAAGYADKGQKLAMITRLLPFVEKNLHLIELAPKGTGKSYLFGRVSRYGWLASGGVMSRARMFYNLGKHTDGLVVGHDYVAMDEVQTISFTDVDEMRGALKGYMENNGKCTVGEKEVVSDAGIVLLGNINADLMTADMKDNVFQELPEVFRESALIDRFHGFLRGWDLPRMTEDLKIKGWALNSEYFTSVLHALRDDPIYRNAVDQWLDVSEGADTRDTEAVKRLTTGFLKLLFPYVRQPGDISAWDFKEYCLQPALRMRETIRYQLGLLDREYRGKDMPNLTVRESVA